MSLHKQTAAYKLKLLGLQHLSLISDMFYFSFQTVTVERIVETNWNSVYTLIITKHERVEFVDEVDSFKRFEMSVDLYISWSF